MSFSVGSIRRSSCPEVGLGKRELLFTPPKGLLDLNIHSHERPKKERRELVRHNLLHFTNWCQYMFLDYMYVSMSNESKLPFGFLAVSFITFLSFFCEQVCHNSVQSTFIFFTT